MSQRIRYTINDLARSMFYQLPQFLFDKEFDGLSSDAKLLYAILKDRHRLSIANGWINENNEVYFIFTREDMQRKLYKSYNTVKKAIDQLISYGLLQEERQGLNKPNRLFLTCVDYEVSKIIDNPLENTGTSKSENPYNSLNMRSFRICESRISDSEDQEFRNLRPIHNNINHNDINQSINQPSCQRNQSDKEENDGWIGEFDHKKEKNVREELSPKKLLWGLKRSKVGPPSRCKNMNNSHNSIEQEYRTVISENIEYDTLKERYANDSDQIDEILEIMVESVITHKETVRVNGEEISANKVKSQLLKLNQGHIEYVLECMNKNTTKAQNIKAYLLTALYNAPMTINTYYNNQTKHDLYGNP